MKKAFILVTAFLVLLLLCSCSVSPESDVVRLIERGDYMEAQTLYYEKVYGNYEREAEVQNQLATRIDETVQYYNEGKLSKDKAIVFLGTIDSSMIFMDVNYLQDAQTMINQLEQSKKAYDEAEMLFEDSDYLGAYQSYASVIEHDIFNDSAKAKSKEAIKNYILQVIADVNEFAKDEEGYISAINMLRDVINELSVYGLENDEIHDTLQSIENSYKNYMIEKSKEAFNNGNDYKKAIQILNTALSTIREDETPEIYQLLLTELSKYEAYIPVNLVSLEPVRQGKYINIGTDFNYRDEVATDMNGVKYQNETVFYPDGGTSSISYAREEKDGTIYYYLNGNYNTLSGKVYTPYHTTHHGDEWESDISVKIYGDGILLYEMPGSVANNKATEEFSVDISGVRELGIVVRGVWAGSTGWPGVYSYYPLICLTDMVVSK